MYNVAAPGQLCVLRFQSQCSSAWSLEQCWNQNGRCGHPSLAACRSVGRQPTAVAEQCALVEAN
uniref:Uncharacterized protein n=1 Tax=Arundo donax TaxID=35708 RepID=A0A0A8XSS6_ARUDO